ncbi:hypothetical protein D3C80_972960 [compost metagenome]
MLDAAPGGGQQAGVEAIGLADDRRQVAEVGEVDLAVGERLVDHRARALEVVPLDADAIGGEGFFQQLLVAQYVGHTAAGMLGAGAQVGHGDADFPDLASLGQRRQPADHRGQGGNGKQIEHTVDRQVHGTRLLVMVRPRYRQPRPVNKY